MDMGQFLAAMCQTTGERLPAAWMRSRDRIAAAAPLVPVRRGERSGSARVSLAKAGIHHEPSAGEIALYGALGHLLVRLLHRSSTRSSERHLTKRADKQTAFIVDFGWLWASVMDSTKGGGAHTAASLAYYQLFFSAKRQHAETRVSEWCKKPIV